MRAVVERTVCTRASPNGSFLTVPPSDRHARPPPASDWLTQLPRRRKTSPKNGRFSPPCHELPRLETGHATIGGRCPGSVPGHNRRMPPACSFLCGNLQIAPLQPPRFAKEMYASVVFTASSQRLERFSWHRFADRCTDPSWKHRLPRLGRETELGIVTDPPLPSGGKQGRMSLASRGPLSTCAFKLSPRTVDT